MKIDRFRPVLLCCSYVLLITSVIIIFPLVFSIFENTNDDEYAFFCTGALCLILGFAGVKKFQKHLDVITSFQLYLITTSCWFLFDALGTIPFIFGLPHLSITDAAFESFSGITTTGSTILSDIENLPPSILVWRGLLQWVGGIGIIVLSIAILPYLRIGGMRLFSTESSNWSGQSLPRVSQMAMSILTIYVSLSLICALLFLLFGMSPFDAAIHAMTTLSTGGYSNYDASFGHFASKPALLWIASLFMVLGALPFIFYVNLIRRRQTHNLIDSQIKGFILFLIVVITLLSIERIISSNLSTFENITQVTFNVISITTTTGYASTDYTLWGQFAVMLFFYLMFVGGCSGSTSGSMKFFRFQLAYMMLKNQLKQMTYPNGVFSLKYNGQVVTDDIIRSVVAFSMFFAMAIAIIAAILSLSGLDFITSITAAITAVTNVGPGLGEIIGPAGNFSSLPDHVKWSLSIGMLFGRLEIMTILVLLTPAIWKK